jgi:hypothetical protein
MGIDEIHLIKPHGVIANIQNNTVVELLPNRNKDTIIKYLTGLQGKEGIAYVAMDVGAIPRCCNACASRGQNRDRQISCGQNG